MGHLDAPKGAVARLMYFDEFSRSYRLKAPYVYSLWAVSAGLILSWIVAVW
jgi:hypothetical protein